MLKILHIIPNLRKGGAERLVLDICIALRNISNVEVKLVAFSKVNEYQDLSKEVDWKNIPSTYVPSISGKALKNVEALQTFIENFQPNVIHTHLWQAEMVTRQIAFPKAKWFSHFHDNMVQLNNFSFPLTKQKLTNYFERRLILKKYRNLNNRFICISAHSFNYANKVLPKYFVDDIYLLPNSINVDRFKSSKTKVSSNGILNLVSVGSLVAKKNQQFLLKVATNLYKKGIKFHLKILGDGPTKALLENETKKEKLESFVTLQGNVDNPEDYYWNADIYVHSASYEPLGLVLLEAMAAGLPVVTLDGGGNRDLIEQGKNGFMVFEEDVELFAKQILEIWNDKSKYDEMSVYAMEYAKKYDIQAYCKKLLKLYKEA